MEVKIDFLIFSYNLFPIIKIEVFPKNYALFKGDMRLSSEMMTSQMREHMRKSERLNVYIKNLWHERRILGINKYC